jgi:hypothetical protein
MQRSAWKESSANFVLRGEVPEEKVEAALAAIEYRRQWGSLWWDNPDDDTIPAPPWIE